jgi:chromatin segregation and condensation protein Rec8/ScpA/Scc1 (kleisin family)
MAALDFKRGDRRKLQRAIREYTSSSTSQREYVPDYSPLLSRWQAAFREHAEASPKSSQAARTTRLYRRHPRPDPNAPHKPKTAYVLFGEHVRQDPTLSRSSFTDIAKETGKRWRDLSYEERVNTREAPADNRLEKYKEDLECYRETEEYRNYQMYLEQFKQQQHHSESMGPSDNKSSSAQKIADSNQPPVTLKGLEATYQERMDMISQDLRSQSPDTASLTKDSMDEVRSISKALGVNTHLIRVTAFPQENMTARAVNTFLDGTGSLLFLWNREEAEDLVRSVYHPQHDTKLTHATEVFAMSAVGTYCDADTPLAREKFLHLFLYMLSSSLKMCDLCYMRLLICLAICRFTNYVDSARRLCVSA